MNNSSINHPAVYCVCITSMTHVLWSGVPWTAQTPNWFCSWGIQLYVKTIRNDHYHVLQYIILWSNIFVINVVEDSVFLDMMPHYSVIGSWCCEGKWCLYIQWSRSLIIIRALQPWRWRHCVLFKCWELITQWCSIICQKESSVLIITYSAYALLILLKTSTSLIKLLNWW
jgi:hypothetical protein